MIACAVAVEVLAGESSSAAHISAYAAVVVYIMRLAMYDAIALWYDMLILTI